MKRLIIIFFLFILFFNFVGYKAIFFCLENKASKNIEKKIDNNNFDISVMVEIKIPLNMPYYSDKEYENTCGETEIEGKQYQYIKRKIKNDTLYLLCLPNNEKTNILAQKKEIENGKIDGLKKESKKNKAKHILNKISDIEYIENLIYPNQNNIDFKNCFKHKTNNSFILNLFLPKTPTPPPNFFI